MEDSSPCQLTREQEEFFLGYYWWFEHIVQSFMCISGISINIITLVVLASDRMKNECFNQLRICLAIFDTLYLASGISEILRSNMERSREFDEVFVNFLYPFRNVLFVSSMYICMSISIERYNAIARPHLQRNRRRDSSNFKRLFRYISPVIILSVLYCIPKCFELRTVEKLMCVSGTNLTRDSNCTTYHEIEATDMRNNKDYLLWYMNISNLIVTCIVPVSVLVFSSYKTYRSLNAFPQLRARDRRMSGIDERSNEERRVFTLFSMVGLFIACNTLRFALNFDEVIYLEFTLSDQARGCHGVRLWTVYAVPISATLLRLNHGANFFLYCYYDETFKHEFKLQLQKIKATCCIMLMSESILEQTTTTTTSGDRGC